MIYYDLKNHISSAHEGKKPSKWDICTAIFENTLCYQFMKERGPLNVNFNSMLVTNDAAERGIKIQILTIFQLKTLPNGKIYCKQLNTLEKKMKDDKKCTVQECFNTSFNM